MQRARRHVVEEEQRTGALHQDVSDAVVDDVVADRAHPAQPCRQLDLRADTVGRRDEDGVVHGGDRLGREDATEAADATQHLGAVRSLDGRPHPRDGPVALGDVDAGGGVGRQFGARRPPADVSPHLHPVEPNS